MVALFIATRLGAIALGVRFDATPLGTYWQFIDPQLLRHDLLRSLWYQHTQPPLYNLLVGIVLHVSPGHLAGAFQLLSALAGLALVLVLYRLLLVLGIGPRVALAAAAVVCVNPGMVLYENWLYVETFIAALLVVAALLLATYARSGSGWRPGAAFAVLGAVVLSRTLFHIVWLIGVVVIVWVLLPARRRVTLRAAAVPVLLCAGIYLKNGILFGSYSTSSCLGINAGRIATFQLTDAERQSLVARGTLSRYATLNPFALPDLDAASFAATRPRGVPLLDRPSKSTGAANLDHLAYLDLCGRYVKDAEATVVHRPVVIGRSLREASLIWAEPAGDRGLFSKTNRRALSTPLRAYDLVVFGQPRPSQPTSTAGDFGWSHVGRRLSEVGWFVVIGYGIALVAGGRLLWQLRRDQRHEVHRVVAAFCLLTIAYVTAVGNVLEAGENNRFHLLTDTLVIVVILMLASRWAARAARGGMDQTAGSGRRLTR